jgi:hypothetical protein
VRPGLLEKTIRLVCVPGRRPGPWGCPGDLAGPIRETQPSTEGWVSYSLLSFPYSLLHSQIRHRWRRHHLRQRKLPGQRPDRAGRCHQILPFDSPSTSSGWQLRTPPFDKLRTPGRRGGLYSTGPPTHRASCRYFRGI